ncbi:MAG TPA: ABC transporter ATP-binding protein [Bacteroidia bacterium]|jgi:peptide/nickel transport system ATP-binding protein|nr:ABC transporter ATP-binding protein [Bacteroidia bacterium]
MSDTLLEVKNLTVDFKSEDDTVRAVDGISYSLNKGESLGIVGESGSGKTVSSLALMRLIPSSGKVVSGELLFNSRTRGLVDVTKLGDKEMRSFRGNEIAMVFQEPMTSLNPVYTCGDQVMEAIILHQHVSKKESRNRTLELFKQVKLPRPEAIIDSYPHQLSGGQKQRVMIAMAMSCKPSILVCDEPTTALDVTVQAAILDLMKELQAEHNMSIIFISHDLGVIAEIAEKVLVMYKGRIVEQGNILDVYANPQHPYTKGLLACRPPLDKRLYILPTVSDFMKPAQDGGLNKINVTVSDIVDKYIITPEVRKQAHEKLYKQEPILQVKNLKTYFPIKKGLFGKTYDYVKAVDDLTFDIYPGETLGVVGESGSGKTTLGRTILRLIEPTSGSIIYKGQDLLKLSDREMREYRKKLQIIFQDPYSSLNPRITIGEAIMEPMQVHKILKSDRLRKDRVIELLERVNMNASHFERYPHEFSGGQRQRICIARAVALNPEFIICDESVSSLDVSVQAQALNLLAELRKDFGFSYIFISHDISVVKFIADRMLVLYNGKIEELGDADDIYFNPQKDYTKRLIGAIPKGRIEDIRASMESRKLRKTATVA